MLQSHNHHHNGKVTLQVYGLMSHINFQVAKCCAQDLSKKRPDAFNHPNIHPMPEFEWTEWLSQRKNEHKGEVWAHEDAVMVYLDNLLIGETSDLLNWASQTYNYEDYRSEMIYETLRQHEYKSYFDKSQNDFVYMDLVSNNEPLGRLLIELNKKKMPKTSANFRSLCSGELGNRSYRNSIIHRIVPNGWIQGGDIVNGRGNGSTSIYGDAFEDESFCLKHNKRGIIGMANMGRHTNGSQFYITLQPAPFMDKKYCAFGQVIEGSETLKHIENLATQNERPVKECKIIDCGIFEYEI